MKKVYSKVYSFIQLTSDCPSTSNPSGFMPLLDIEVQVKDNKLLHVLYKKAVSNPLLISKNSAMPFRVSGSQATQEILEILSEFSHKLMLSGWDAKSRYDFIIRPFRHVEI